MTNPGQTHWTGCATDGGPAHYECAVERVSALENENHQLLLYGAHMTDLAAHRGAEIEALKHEIARLRALTTPRPIETAPKDGTDVMLFDGWWRQGRWDERHQLWANAYSPTHWLPLPEDPK